MINLTLNMFVKSVEIYDKYISFGVPVQSALKDGGKSPTIWFNFICIGVAYGKLKERGIKSGDKVEIIKAYPKVSESGKLTWIVTDIN